MGGTQRTSTHAHHLVQRTGTVAAQPWQRTPPPLKTARAMAALSQKPTYLSITSLVCSEITGVTTQLRADARASVSSYMGASATIPRLQRSFKKARDVALHYGPDHDCMEYLEPFLETIRCEETTGVVTQRALSAVHCFLRAELLSLNPSSAPAAMVAVVKAATYCRFEVTDPAADEVCSPPPRPQGGWPPAGGGCGSSVRHEEGVRTPLSSPPLGSHPFRHHRPAPWPAMPVSGGAHVYPAAARRLHRVQRRCTPPLPRPAEPRPSPSPTPNLRPNPPSSPRPNPNPNPNPN